MPKTVLQLFKYYKGNAPLLNCMVRPSNEHIRTVVCYLGGSDDGLNRMESVAAETLYCNIPKRKINWAHRATVKRLVDIIDRYEVDLLVCQFRRTIPLGVIAAAMSKRRPKAIGVLHGIVGGKVGWARKLINFFAYRRLEKMVSVSEFGMENIVRLNIGLHPDKVVAIQNGLMCQPFLEKPTKTRSELFPALDSDGFFFAMVGRLAPVKNHVRVLHAFRRVIDKHPEARLLVIGTGPVETQLKTIIEEEGLQAHVSLLGYRKDVADILKVIDVYLMPSLREGLPMALMEAMASSLPVITSNVAGMKELVPDATFGYPVEPNSIDSIANAMLSAMECSDSERKAVGERAKERIIRHFTAERMANNYEQLYRELLK